MTQEEQMKENAKAQHESWLKNEKLNCRKKALSSAEGLRIPNAELLLKEAQTIYEWLISDLIDEP